MIAFLILTLRFLQLLNVPIGANDIQKFVACILRRYIHKYNQFWSLFVVVYVWPLVLVDIHTNVLLLPFFVHAHALYYTCTCIPSQKSDSTEENLVF